MLKLRTFLVSFLFLALVGLGWVNYRFVSPHFRDEYFTRYWVGTRTLLLKGENPYSDEVTLQVQEMIYGRAARAGEYPLAVTYPLYASIFFLPFAALSDYLLARAIWLVFLELVLACSVFCWVRLAAWKLPSWEVGVWLLFVTVCSYTLIPWVGGNVIFLAAFFFALALLALRADRHEMAGVLLALALIEPQALWLAVLFVLLWAASQGRWTLILSFVGSSMVGIVLGMFVRPDWPLQYLRLILHTDVYPPPRTLGSVLAAWWPGIGHQLGWGVTIVSMAVLLAEWWQARQWKYSGFLWTLSLTLVVAQWVGIPASPANFVLLYLPLVIASSTWEERAGALGRGVALATWLLVGVGGWWIVLAASADGLPWPARPLGLLVLFPLVLLVGLYWVRWWAVRPRRLFIEELRTLEEL